MTLLTRHRYSIRRLLCLTVLISGLAPVFLWGDVYSDFEYSWGFYQKLVKRNVSYAERLATVDRVIRKYGDSADNRIDMTLVKTERNFVYSWMFYRRQVAGGTSDRELEATLKRIIRKYDGKGVDVSQAHIHLKKLQERMAGRSQVQHQQQVQQVQQIQERIVYVVRPSSMVVTNEQPAEQKSSDKPAEKKAKKKSKPPKPVKPKKPKPKPKLAGLEIKHGTGIGLMGYQAVFNVYDLSSIVLGYGTYSLSTTAGSAGTEEKYTSYLGLLRYGSNYYGSAGFLQKTIEASAASGALNVSLKNTSYGIPILAGFETGDKNSYFFNIELGYVYYFVRDTSNLTSTSGSLTLTIDPAESGLYYGLGVGWYFY